jgi:hypothetical protein
MVLDLRIVMGGYRVWGDHRSYMVDVFDVTGEVTRGMTGLSPYTSHDS